MESSSNHPQNWPSLFRAYLRNLKWQPLENTTDYYYWANLTITKLDKAVRNKFFEITYDEWIRYYEDRSGSKPRAFMDKMLRWKDRRAAMNETEEVREMRFILEVYFNNPNILPNY
jgi:hypothetical protein